MMLYGGSPTASYDSNCSTGCPTCGCCNPNCRYGGNTWGFSTNNWIVSYEPEPELKVPPIEPWLAEQRRTPRKMKRSFPANKPAPHRAYRRACY